MSQAIWESQKQLRSVLNFLKHIAAVAASPDPTLYIATLLRFGEILGSLLRVLQQERSRLRFHHFLFTSSVSRHRRGRIGDVRYEHYGHGTLFIAVLLCHLEQVC